MPQCCNVPLAFLPFGRIGIDNINFDLSRFHSPLFRPQTQTLVTRACHAHTRLSKSRGSDKSTATWSSGRHVGSSVHSSCGPNMKHSTHAELLSLLHHRFFT